MLSEVRKGDGLWISGGAFVHGGIGTRHLYRDCPWLAGIHYPVIRLTMGGAARVRVCRTCWRRREREAG